MQDDQTKAGSLASVLVAVAAIVYGRSTSRSLDIIRTTCQCHGMDQNIHVALLGTQIAKETQMNDPLRARLTRRTAIATALAVATVVSGGGYALASSNSTGHTAQPGDGSAALSAVAPRLKYLVGTNVVVPADSAGSNATKCPAGMYPVGGGPSSANAVWQIQWSDPDRSTPAAAHPNEWTVGLFNNSGSAAAFKVFVVCATASSVSGNY